MRSLTTCLLRSAIRAMLLLTLLSTTGGCSARGVISYKVFGPPSQPAMYRIAQVPTLILCENFDHPTTSARDSEMLQQLTFEQFLGHKIAPVISPEFLNQIRGRMTEEQFRKLSIANLGRQAGAEQVVYIDLVQAGIESAVGSDFLRGRGSVRVRLISTKTGETIWPREVSEGFPISFETPVPRSDQRTNSTLARAQLHEGLALRIGRLFRKWKADETGTTEFVDDP
jgi:hypothetical protein